MSSTLVDLASSDDEEIVALHAGGAARREGGRKRYRAAAGGQRGKRQRVVYEQDRVELDADRMEDVYDRFGYPRRRADRDPPYYPPGMSGLPPGLPVSPASREEQELERALELSRAAAKVEEDARLMREQDEELKRSIEMDRSRAAKRRRMEAGERQMKRSAEEAAKAKAQRKEQRQRDLENKLRSLEQALPSEPPASAPAVRIRLDIPGRRVTRSFAPQARLGDLLHWVMTCDERALRADSFDVVLPDSSRVSSRASAAQLSAPLSRLNLDRSCVRVTVTEEGEEDEDEDEDEE